jgi:hypothetical protein
MGKITAQAKVFRDWESLVASCINNGELLPGVEPLKADLEALLGQAKAMKADQENLKGNRQERTQRLNQIILNGEEAARKIRGFVRIRLGSRSEHLVQFGVPPIRKRPGRAKAAKVPAPASPEVPETPAKTEA